jgi:putative ABC transport system permease protein
MLGLIARSIIHRPVRNGALILAFAFIAASLFSGHYLLAGASDSVKSEIARLGADLIVVPANYTADSEAVLLRGEPSTFFFDDSVVPRIRNVSGVEQVEPQIFIASLTASCCSLPVQLIAIDPSQDFTITPWLEAKQQKPLAPDEIIVGSKIVAGGGTTLTFFGHSFIVAGRLDPTGTGLDTTQRKVRAGRSIFPRGLHLPFSSGRTMQPKQPMSPTALLTRFPGREFSPRRPWSAPYRTSWRGLPGS